jgi:hypothetical protein
MKNSWLQLVDFLMEYLDTKVVVDTQCLKNGIDE